MRHYRIEGRVRDALCRLRATGRILSGGTWRRALLRLGLLVAVLAAGAIAYGWSGLVSITASSGHSPVTYWFLDFTKRNAVELQSGGTEVPPLGDPAMVLKGAGHFATACAPCHGAPGKDPSIIAQQMTPKPPPLVSRISRWRPAELFWIVKHGIKYTGMPAWPALERDDEIWSMVSFLLELPSLQPEAYDRMAYGERMNTDSEEMSGELHALNGSLTRALANCARCHGTRGAGRAGAFPRLAGQREEYLFASLRAFANGHRFSGIMQSAVAGLSEERLRELAGHYARQHDATAMASPEAGAARIARGREIAERGIPARGIPSCSDCHGPGTGARNPLYPELSGQYAEYLRLQLELFKADKRGGTPYAHIMTTVTKRMTAEQMRDVALYYASLPPGRDRSALSLPPGRGL